MKKKILALCLVVVLVATAITGVTLAYFTDYTDVAVNTFTVGNIDIELDEADTDENGDIIPDADRVTENEYKDIYPGQTVVKDPTVTVKEGSESCYVRMFVKVDQDKLLAAFPQDDEDFKDYWMGNIFLLEKLVGDTWDETKWAIQDNVKVVDDKAVYEFWYTEIVAEDDTQDTVLPALFEEITFPAALTNDQVAELEGFTVEVYAEAIQSEGFADDFAAWAAFEPEAQQK